MSGRRKFGGLLLVVAVSAAGGIWWQWEKTATARLQAELEALRREEAERGRLQQEHDRLLALQPPTEELERLRLKIAAEEKPEPMVTKVAAQAINASSLRRNVWVAPSAWRDCGQATPEETLETTLWAVAGGDLGTLKNLLEFDAVARARAQTVLDRGLDVSPSVPPTPEDLLTFLAIREIPVVEAQWLARTDHDADTVTESVALQNSDGKRQQTHLTFHRGEGGWRLMVPTAAVERMTQAFLGESPPPSAEIKKSDVSPPQGPQPRIWNQDLGR